MPFAKDDNLFGSKRTRLNFLQKHNDAIATMCNQAKEQLKYRSTNAAKVSKKSDASFPLSVLALRQEGTIHYYLVPNRDVSTVDRAEGGYGIFKPIKRILPTRTRNGDIVLTLPPKGEKTLGFKRMKVSKDFQLDRPTISESHAEAEGVLAREEGKDEYEMLKDLGRDPTLFNLTNQDDVDKTYVLMEYYENGDLNEFISAFNEGRADGSFTDEELIDFVDKIIEEVLDFHGKTEMLHRDIKPQNFCLDADFNPKLIDFGFAVGIEHAAEANNCGTRGYLAPEVDWLSEARRDSGLGSDPTYYSCKSDGYAVGITLSRLLDSAAPTPDQSKIVEAIKDRIVEPLMERDPDKRITLGQAKAGIMFYKAEYQQQQQKQQASSSADILGRLSAASPAPSEDYAPSSGRTTPGLDGSQVTQDKPSGKSNLPKVNNNEEQGPRTTPGFGR